MNFNIYTLGCKVNSYESNFIAEVFTKNGHIKVESNLDIVIINTCSVTSNSDTKSRQLITRLHRENSQAIMIVFGCYARKEFEHLKSLGFINILLGTSNRTKIYEYYLEYLDKKENIYDDSKNDNVFEDLTITSFNNVRAYLKIQDGCDAYCSFCIIPYLRGKPRCKKVDVIISEINTLEKNGFHEIVLTGIHIGRFKENNLTFSDLIKLILDKTNIQRIRISSIEINEVDEQLINLFNTNKRLVNHLHIPLQSGSNTVLGLMRRKYNIEYYLKRIELIRKLIPNVCLSTDVICGFPMESDENFSETITNIKKINFAKLHVFPYSLRSGTEAASFTQVDPIIKKVRSKKLIELSAALEDSYAKQFINSDLEVLFEQSNDDYTFGHSTNYLLVHVPKDDSLIGKIVTVKINKNKQLSVYGTINMLKL